MVEQPAGVDRGSGPEMSAVAHLRRYLPARPAETFVARGGASGCATPLLASLGACGQALLRSGWRSSFVTVAEGDGAPSGHRRGGCDEESHHPHHGGDRAGLASRSPGEGSPSVRLLRLSSLQASLPGWDPGWRWRPAGPAPGASGLRAVGSARRDGSASLWAASGPLISSTRQSPTPRARGTDRRGPDRSHRITDSKRHIGRQGNSSRPLAHAAGPLRLTEAGPYGY